MAFARLAPHCGLTPVYGHYVGNCEMRGGFSWASLGSTLSSGVKNLGSFLGNTVRKVGNSEAFQQAKQGFLNSGVIENAGSLAGSTINSLVDIGRLKLEQDLMKLRDRAIGRPDEAGTVPPITQEQLAQLLAAANTSQAPLAPTVLPEPAEVTVPVAVSPPVPPPRRLPPPPVPVPRPSYLPPAPTDAVALGPLVQETVTEEPAGVVVDSRSFYPPPRKRKRVSGWGAALDRMTGGRVAYDATRYCY